MASVHTHCLTEPLSSVKPPQLGTSTKKCSSLGLNPGGCTYKGTVRADRARTAPNKARKAPAKARKSQQAACGPHYIHRTLFLLAAFSRHFCCRANQIDRYLSRTRDLHPRRSSAAVAELLAILVAAGRRTKTPACLIMPMDATCKMRTARAIHLMASWKKESIPSLIPSTPGVHTFATDRHATASSLASTTRRWEVVGGRSTSSATKTRKTISTRPVHIALHTHKQGGIRSIAL